MKSESAQSNKCKRLVHVNVVVIRILNTSARLDWSACVAPVLTDYFVRMKQGGYNEMYRKRMLEQALRVYDRLIDDENSGLRPIHRPKDWCGENKNKERSMGGAPMEDILHPLSSPQHQTVNCLV